MAIESAPYYWLVCDFPGCDARSTEGSEYAAWADGDQAREDASSNGWLLDQPGGDFCVEHTMWDDDKDELVPVLKVQS